MTFWQVQTALMSGMKITRDSWEGGLHLFIPGITGQGHVFSNFGGQGYHGRPMPPDLQNRNIYICPTITPDGSSFSGVLWMASAKDLLATDWSIL